MRILLLIGMGSLSVDKGIIEKEINISALSSGLYYLTMTGIEGKFVTRIVKR